MRVNAPKALSCVAPLISIGDCFSPVWQTPGQWLGPGSKRGWRTVYLTFHPFPSKNICRSIAVFYTIGFICNRTLLFTRYRSRPLAKPGRFENAARREANLTNFTVCNWGQLLTYLFAKWVDSKPPRVNFMVRRNSLKKKTTTTTTKIYLSQTDTSLQKALQTSVH